MKRTGVCPKCRCERLLHVSQVADTTGELGEQVEGDPKEGATYASSKAWRLARVPVPPDRRSLFRPETLSAGLVEAFVCRDCGHTEFYTRDPESIPIDGQVVQEVGPPKPRS